jgi:hypothetical protein
VGSNIRVQRSQSEIRPVVYKSAILGTKTDMFRNREIRAAAVHKSELGLAHSSQHGLGCVGGRVKNQRARTRQNVGVQSEDTTGKGPTRAPAAWCTLA